MFEQFASAVNELASVVGYTVLVASVVYTGLRIITSLIRGKRETY